MLPNWLYGKSLRKLQEILNSGGQTAAGVSYSNTESGLEATNAQDAIDEIAEDLDTKAAQSTVSTLSDTVTTLTETVNGKAALTQISNPNLLDNPWFTINQRGQSSYTSNNNTYTVDRWENIQPRNLTVAVTDDGVTLTSGNDAGEDSSVTFTQRVEGDVIKKLIGKSITFSVLFADGTIKSVSAVVPSSISTTPANIIDEEIISGWNLTIYGRTTSAGSNCHLVCHAPNSTISIRAVKLEVGSVSTLAMDTAPNYATELLKCQRYFVRFGSGESVAAYRYNLGMAFENESNAYYNALLPIPMRSTPSISYQGSWAIGSKLLNSITVNSMINNIVKLVCTTSETLTPAKIELLENKEAGISYIDLSADL